MNLIEQDKRARAIAATNQTKCRCWHWIVMAFMAGALLVLTFVS